jgi:hypothetical protein
MALYFDHHRRPWYLLRSQLGFTWECHSGKHGDNPVALPDYDGDAKA